jgi:hypothetical protein
MRAVAPQIKTVEQPVQLLDRQHDGFVGVIGRCFETFGFEAFEPKTEAVALPVEDFHSIPVAIQKDEKHRVEHSDFDIQFDQGSETVNGFSKIHRLGVQIHFFHFCIGSHHDVQAPERNREQSIGDQVGTLNVGFMDPLLIFCIIELIQ